MFVLNKTKQVNSKKEKNVTNLCWRFSIGDFLFFCLDFI